MPDITIRTNQRPRDLLYWHDLTDKERKEFDWLDTDEARESELFFRYKGWTYALSEFSSVLGLPTIFKGWDGYKGDSFFSGVLVKLVDDNERAICATYFS